MMQLTIPEQLKELKTGDKIYVIRDGNCVPYIFCCINPKVLTHAIVIHGGAYVEAKSLFITGKYRFQAMYYGEYDSKFVGNVMLAQHEQSIKVVKEVYLKEVHNGPETLPTRVGDIPGERSEFP